MVIALIEDASINEDSSFSYTLSGSDIDEGDVLSYSAESDGNSSVAVFDDLLTVVPYPDYDGSIIITAIVSDDSGLTDSTEFILDIIPINDAPYVLNALSDLTVDENSDDIVIDLSNVFFDVENGSDLSYNVNEEKATIDLDHSQKTEDQLYEYEHVECEPDIVIKTDLQEADNFCEPDIIFHVSEL